MMNDITFEIPYSLETTDALRRALEIDLLGLGSDSSQIMEAALKVNLVAPLALEKARKMVKKDFFMLKEKKTLELDFKKIEITDLEVIDNFSSVEQSISWAKRIASYESVFDAFGHISGGPEEYRADAVFSSGRLELLLKIKALIRREIIANANSGRGRHLDRNALKEILVAFTLFDSANEDILMALRMPEGHSSKDLLYQNACAELLFERLPVCIREIVLIDPKHVRQKLFTKCATLGLSGQQKMALFGYFKANTRADELISVLDKLETIARKILGSDTAERLRHFISSIKRKLEYTTNVYKELFLSSGHEEVRKLYKPGNVMRSTVSYKERIIKSHVKVATLAFYPTKDYLDILKGQISVDCTGLSLGTKHLNVPNFFNIRIFRGSQWHGNIYLLDFTKERGILLVDRIQLPRGINADYINFFDYLKSVFEEMFAEMAYEKILLPLAVSNHEAIQSIFNRYKEKLKQSRSALPLEYAGQFESLRGQRVYYVLCER